MLDNNSPFLVSPAVFQTWEKLREAVGPEMPYAGDDTSLSRTHPHPKGPTPPPLSQWKSLTFQIW